MPEREPSFWDYVREAFWVRWPVKGLGRVPVNVLYVGAAAVAGLANPGFWLVGAAVEIAYLAWLSHHPRFRNLVRGSWLQRAALAKTERLQALVSRLPTEGRARWYALQRRCEQIGSPGTGEAADRIAEMHHEGLDSLLGIFARLLLSREGVLTFTRESESRELQERLEEAETRLREVTSDAARRPLQSNIDILKKRIEYRKGARENLLILEAELDRIENQVEMLREEAAVTRDPAALSERIDAVARTIGETSQFLQQSEALVGSLGAEEGPAPSAPEGARKLEVPDGR